MKLYYKPGACSLASHIVLKEMNADFKIEKVDTEKGLTESGEDFAKINVKGYVPALALSKDEIITEGPSILQYLADQSQQHELLPSIGNLSRTRVIEYLTYTNSELHKAFGPLFTPGVSDTTKNQAKAEVAEKLTYLQHIFSDDRDYLVDNKISIADIYLFVVCNWCGFVGISLDNLPHIASFVKRMAQRPAVKSAMHAEGLL